MTSTSTSVTAAVAGLALVATVTMYAVFAGADFGAGFWDLIAGGPQHGARVRGLAEHAIGPVWEANHVWLIFTLVIMWSAFPSAFAAVFLTLFVPLACAAIGIVLRGCGFAFRKVVRRTRRQQLFGATFATSSVIVPFFMGTVAGGIASGRVPADGRGGDVWGSWLNPTSALGGVLAVAVCAYLAAVYLTADARRSGEPDLERYFRHRAVVAAVVTGVIAVGGIGVLHSDAGYLSSELTSRALPLVIASAVAGLAALGLVLRGVARTARALAAAAAASVVWGWGVGQWPYLLPTSVRLDDAVAPRGTIIALIVIIAMAAVTVIPSLVLLLLLEERGALEA
ncbi:MAG TPA: cytochrome d ubiquinol oxidase subunit II [Candidatus Dormibacteraeota bacterium]|nr:cytochrome d ubiquinol oxidase subunit II [Candidatus Dormibacteraeota bacterium]